MTCDDIKKALKPFLEDLLKEEEYQAFLEHLKECSKCRDYVRAFDSFSNQLWKLGDVEVPTDFCSTVLFKLSNPKQGFPKLKSVISKLFFGMQNFNLRKSAQKKDEAASTSIETAEEKQNPVNNQETELLVKGLKKIVEVLEVPEKENAVKEDFSKKETASEEDSKEPVSAVVESPVLSKPFNEDEPSFLEARSLHWHVNLALPEQRSQLLAVIQEKGGTINYEFEEKIFFSIPGTEIKKLKEQMLVMRIGLSESGYPGREGPESNSEPVVVSVYFSK